MLSFRLKKIIAYLVFPTIISACAPLVPDNYLAPRTVRTAQKVNGRWIEPCLIPISVKMLQSQEGHELLEPALRPQEYRIGAYDNLNIIIWGHPELSTVSSVSNNPVPSSNSLSALSQLNVANNPAVLVETDGTIFYPYVGRIKVSGLTINQVQNKIGQRISTYIRNPQVTVQVAKFRNRNSYVLGEVKQPGMQPLTDKPLTLMEAISSAGGINPMTADPTHIYLIRGSYIKPDIFWLDAQSPQALLIAEQFPLHENDIVYVSAATFNSWNNFITTVFPTFTTYFTIKGLAQ